MLVLGRRYCKRCLARCLILHLGFLKLMSRSLEDLSAFRIKDCHDVVLMTDLDGHHVCAEDRPAVFLAFFQPCPRLCLYIDHLRHSLGLSFMILYSDCIVLKRCEGQSAFSEGNPLTFRTASAQNCRQKSRKDIDVFHIMCTFGIQS